VRGVFVTGTDTGVGKTLLCACLLTAFTRARYAKPVQTGWPADDDTATVVGLARAGPGRALAGGVRLKAPVSPHHAADPSARVFPPRTSRGSSAPPTTAAPGSSRARAGC
jgi:malonyl-CoA O-methyltransferase